jgi:hypothetical protein
VYCMAFLQQLAVGSDYTPGPSRVCVLMIFCRGRSFGMPLRFGRSWQ